MAARGGRIRRIVAGYTGFSREARLLLLTTFVAGGAISLYWIDFNLYLRALGFDDPSIGLVSTVGQLTAALISFPAAALSDRLGRRWVLVVGLVAMTVATVGFIPDSSLAVIAVLVALYAGGQQAFFIVSVPYMAEHSDADNRSELFAAQFALQQVTNIVAALVGGVVATAIARELGLAEGGADTYRIVLVLMTGFFVAGLAALLRLRDDRPRRPVRPPPEALGEPARFPRPHLRVWSARRWGIVVVDRGRFARLVLPGFLIAIGAGQLIPFLNLFIEIRFGLDLTAINAVFAVASLGTLLAILLQPALARRLGKVGSVVVVQAVSIPFIVVLGFSPALWSVIIAMAVRNALMNAGNPIQNAFAMEHVDPAERATLSAAMSVLWSIGWVVAGAYFTALHLALGFDAYALNFVTTIVLYTIGTVLYWWWFRDAERRDAARAGGTGSSPSAAVPTG
jgi:MFS family permease